MCGWLGFGDLRGEAADRALREMLRTLDLGGETAAAASGPGWGLALTARAARTIAVHDGVAVVLLGEPRFLDTGRQAEARATGAAAVAAREFRQRGVSMLEVLGGSFALAIVDPQRREALLAVDRMAIEPLAFTEAPAGIAFATTCRAINGHPGIVPQIDLQSLHDYVHFHMVPAPRTAFVGQVRLNAGTYLHHRDGRSTIGRYWKPTFDERDRRPFGQLKREFRDALDEAVRNHATDAAVGAFLSGGTDSSTIAGLLGRVTGRRIPTFSIGFDVPEYNELGYARIAADRFGTDHHEYMVTPEDVVAALPRIARSYDAPFGNASAVPTFYCARLAREHGVARLLGGDGGDELFGGNARYGTQWLFSLYGRIPAPLRHGVLEPAAAIPGLDRIGLVRKARSYMAQASIPLPDRLESYNLLARIGAGRIFTSDFLAAIDPASPLEAQRQRFREAGDCALINRMLAYDFKFTLADNDLPKVTRMCDVAGVDVSFPMLDDDVVAFASRLAPDLKLRRTKLRYFFKLALADLLPREIIAKTKHGFGLPFGVWLATARPLADFARAHLQRLRSRGVVRPEFIDELWDTLLPSHPGYYGTMIWILLMLELWYCEQWDGLDVAAERRA
jgi:asparagine synthase (glutamine-hydrolysing)